MSMHVKGFEMTDVFGIIIGFILIAYLFITIIRPEKF